MEKACRKRKEPKQRLRDAKPCIKKARNQSDSLSTSFLSTSNDVFDDAEEEINEDDLKLENCKATQTDMKHELARELANRVDRIISNNQLKVPTETLRIVSNLSYEVVVQNSKLMKHYVGLTSSQFKILYEFLDDICPLKLITFWSFSKNNQVTKEKLCARGRLSKLSAQEKLFICLLRLKTGFSIVTLAHLFDRGRFLPRSIPTHRNKHGHS